ncbi:MAG: protealysin propeptide domain-containing protein, partial [Leptolyngbyaceae cyanobacterium MO_188.B28]|nr:protealysin propeptide domain-containing protein [Leptolyngbyaceae cyanobacterium MO_188.B28]
MATELYHLHHRHNPLESIVPPYLLMEIAEHGSPLQRERALRELARSGQFRGQRQQLAELAERRAVREAVTVKQRTVYDAEHTTNLPGNKVRGEGDSPTGDLAVDEAYDGSGATYDLYQLYGRNSIDDRGMTLISTVHYEEG